MGLIQIIMMICHAFICKNLFGISSCAIKSCRVGRDLLTHNVECFVFSETYEAILNNGRKELTESVISNEDHPSPISGEVDYQPRLTRCFGIRDERLDHRLEFHRKFGLERQYAEHLNISISRVVIHKIPLDLIVATDNNRCWIPICWNSCSGRKLWCRWHRIRNIRWKWD